MKRQGSMEGEEPLEDEDNGLVNKVTALQLFWLRGEDAGAPDAEGFVQAVAIKRLEGEGSEAIWEVMLAPLPGSSQQEAVSTKLVASAIEICPRHVPPEEVLSSLSQNMWLRGSLQSVQDKRGITASPIADMTDTEAGSVEEEEGERSLAKVPLGGVLYSLRKAKTDNVMSGFFCYISFLVNFIVISNMLRPVSTIYEVHQAIHGELVSEAFPMSMANFEKTFLHIANFGDFWGWVEGVLMDKAFAEEYYSTGPSTDPKSPYKRQPHAMHTIAKYNRLLGPIRFRTVRVEPTVELCPVIGKETNLDKVLNCRMPRDEEWGSCSTPKQHRLARPCWGAWRKEYQSSEFISKQVRETKLLPEQENGYFYRRSPSSILPLKDHNGTELRLNRWWTPSEKAWSVATPPTQVPSWPRTDMRCPSFCAAMPRRSKASAACIAGGFADLMNDQRRCDEAYAFAILGVGASMKSLTAAAATATATSSGSTTTSTTTTTISVDTCTKQCDTSSSRWVDNEDLSVPAGGEVRLIEYCGKGSNGECAAHIVDLPLDAAEAWRRVRAMMRDRWTNEGTRLVQVELNMYNANLDLAVVCRLIVEVLQGGLVETSAQLRSARLFPYSSSTEDSIRMILEAIFFVQQLYFIAQEARKIGRQRWNYVKVPWNVLDFANQCVFAYISFHWASYNARTSRHLFTKRQEQFQDLWSLGKDYIFVSRVASFNIALCFLRLFKYLQLYGRFMVLFDVLADAFPQMVCFMIIYTMFLLAFAWSGHWIFGPRLFEFHTFQETALYLLLSTTEGIGYPSLKEAGPQGGLSGSLAAPLWTFGWFFISQLCLVNFLIAIICDSFVKICERLNRVKELERRFVELFGPNPSLARGITEWWSERLYGWWPCLKDEDDIERFEHLCDLRDVVEDANFERFYMKLTSLVDDGQTIVETADVVHLFKGDEQRAKKFLMRLSVAADLHQVELKDPALEEEETTIDALNRVSNSMDRMEIAIEKLNCDFNAYRDRTTAANARRERRRERRRASRAQEAVAAGAIPMSKLQKEGEAEDDENEEDEPIKVREICFICCQCIVAAMKDFFALLALMIFAAVIHVARTTRRCCSYLSARINERCFQNKADAERRRREAQEARERIAESASEGIQDFFRAEAVRIAGEREMKRAKRNKKRSDEAKLAEEAVGELRFGIVRTEEEHRANPGSSFKFASKAKRKSANSKLDKLPADGETRQRFNDWSGVAVEAERMKWEVQPTILKGLAIAAGTKIPMRTVTHWDVRWLNCIARSFLMCGLGCIGIAVPIMMIIASNREPPTTQPRTRSSVTSLNLSSAKNLLNESLGAVRNVSSLNILNSSAVALSNVRGMTDFKLWGVFPAGSSLAFAIIFAMASLSLGWFWSNVYEAMRKALEDYRTEQLLEEYQDQIAQETGGFDRQISVGSSHPAKDLDLPRLEPPKAADLNQADETLRPAQYSGTLSMKALPAG